MLRDIIRIVWIYYKWICFKLFHGINKDMIVLALANENKKLDDIAVKRFSEMLDKRYATGGMILAQREVFDDIVCNDKRIKVIYTSSKKMEDLFSLYCFYSFTNNIVFTYVDTPKDNYLSDYIKNSDIDENDVVCLALFRLGNL